MKLPKSPLVRSIICFIIFWVIVYLIACFCANQIANPLNILGEKIDSRYYSGGYYMVNTLGRFALSITLVLSVIINFNVRWEDEDEETDS